MIVADVSPVELYGLLMLAIFNSLMAALIFREIWRCGSRKDAAMLFVGLCFVLGLPLAFGVRAVIG